MRKVGPQWNFPDVSSGHFLCSPESCVDEDQVLWSEADQAMRH